MSTSKMPAIQPPKRPRPTGPRKQGPRQHLSSVTRSTMSPAPERARLIRNSPAPIGKTGHARVCLNQDCPGSDIVEDDMGGGLVCRACGTVLNESNIVAENQWVENPGGVAGMAGQFVGGNQAAPRAITGMRHRSAYGPGHEGTDSRYQSELKARATMKTLAPIGINETLMDQGVQIYKLAVQHGLLHGRTIELLAAVSAYVACRRNPKSNTVMLIDIADQLNINLFVLGSLYQKMVEKLKGIGGIYSNAIEAVNPESLVNRFADSMEFGSDKIKIIRDGVHIFKRMKRDWITDGRRPAGIAAAAILLAARMNNYHRTVREMVLHAKMTEITINKRLWEFSNTEAAEWDVEQFRDLARQEAEGAQWEGSGPMGLPPIFYMQQDGAPKRRRGRPRKNPKPGTNTESVAQNGQGNAAASESEHEDSAEETAVSEDERSPKRIRLDADGFKVPPRPMGPPSRPLEPNHSDFSGPNLTSSAPDDILSQQTSSSTQPISHAISSEATGDGQSQSPTDAEPLFTVDQFEDGIMLTNPQEVQYLTESSIEVLDAQQKMRVLDSIEQESSRARALGTGGTIRPSLSEEEKQRRISLNLCLYCGFPGHTHQNCGAAASAKQFKKKLKGRKQQPSQATDEYGIPLIRLTPFSQQDTLVGSTMKGGSSMIGDDASTFGEAPSTFGDDSQSTIVGDDDMQMLTPCTPGISPARSETPSSVTGKRRRGRPRGAKNKEAPEATAAELEMESELTGDMTYALTQGADPADIAHLTKEIGLSGTSATSSTQPFEPIDLTSEIDAAADAVNAARDALRGNTPAIPMTKIPKGGVPVDGNIGNTGLISLSPTLSATEFDNDPEVSTCLLSATEAAIKEQIWVTENAEWLRKDHYKRIQKELHEAAMIAEGRDPEEEAKKKKGRRLGAAPYMEQVRQRRKERLSQTPAGQELTEEEQARLNAAEATYEMVNHKARTAFSRRFNQQSMESIWGDLVSEPSSPSASRTSESPVPGSTPIRTRHHGRISTVSTAVAPPSTHFQAPDVDGPLGPTQGRSSHSIGAEKREARRWAALREEKAARGIPPKISLHRGARLGLDRTGSNDNTAEGSQGSGSPTPDAGPSVSQPTASGLIQSRRGPVRPKRVVRARANANANVNAIVNTQIHPAPSADSSLPSRTEEEQLGVVDPSDTDSPLSSSMASSLLTGRQEGVAGQAVGAEAVGAGSEQPALDPDEDMSSEDDEEEEEEEEDEAEEMEDLEEDLDDAFAGRARPRRRYNTSSGEESDEE